jgi:excisionase family DNA binding protein
MDNLMSVQALAEYLQVSVKTVYRLLERGNIPATKVGHQWRFDKVSIDSWLNQDSIPLASALILVIDDDAAVGYLFQEALRETGHTIDVVQNSSQGLELIKNGNYDLVFLDLLMPGMDGATIFKRIRSVKPELPVTIITGYPDSEVMMSAMAGGPFSVMKKPFSISDILAAVNNYLRFGMTPKNRANKAGGKI